MSFTQFQPNIRASVIFALQDNYFSDLFIEM